MNIKTLNTRIRDRRGLRSLRNGWRLGLQLEALECRRLLAGDGIDPEPFGGSISGTKWVDANRNGAHDEGEVGLADIQIFLDENNNGRFDNGERHTTTRQDDPETDRDETGTYSIRGLDEGRYVVREIVPRGFVQTFPALDNRMRGAHLVELVGGDNVTGIHFGNFPTEDFAAGAVVGTKWHDANGNGEREDDEPGLPGVVIFSDSNHNGHLDRGEAFTRTSRDNPDTPADEAGDYELRLRPGVHVIREVVPEGFVQTFPPDIVIAPGDDDPDAERDEFVTTDPRRLDLQLEEGDAFVGGVSMTVHPFCIVPIHVDVVASDPDIDFSRLSEVQLNGCGGDVSKFEIMITGDGGSHAFDLLFVDPETGNQHAAVPVTINARDVGGGHRVVVRPGQTVGGKDFGNRPVATSRIAGHKWLDANGNRRRDADEPGLAGVVIYLDLNNNGRLDRSDVRTVTRRDDPATAEDETGRYHFGGLTDGEYVVREVVPDGHVQTFPAANATVISSVTGQFNDGNALDMEISDVSAAMDDDGQLTATVDVTVTWPDTCGMLKDGEADQSAVGDNLVIEVHGHQVGDGCGDAETLTTETIEFTGLERGRYDVIVTLHEDVGDEPDIATLNTVGAIVVGAPGHHLVLLGENEVVDGVDFGNRSQRDAASVHGTKWLDRNGNGERERGEPGLPGITIYSDLNVNGILDEGEPQTTSMADNPRTAVNEAGHYWLEGLKPGEHLITEVLPEGFERTFPPELDVAAPWPLDQPYFFNLVAGQQLTGIDFGNHPVKVEGGAVHGRKWADTDGNGERDPSEPGLPGVTIYLDANLNNEFDAGEPRTRTTGDNPDTDFDEAGYYRFNDVEPGFYIVREIVPDGFEQTFPPIMLCEAIFCQGRGHVINVEPGDVIDGLDFGNHPLEIKAGTVHGVKWLDDNGNRERDEDEPGLPGVTIFADLNLNGRRDRSEPATRTMRDDPDTDRDEQGAFWLEVPAGEHVILEVVPPGFEQTFPNPHRRVAFPFNLGHVVNVEAGAEVEGIDFGNRRVERPHGSVAGFKWLDRNGNGERDRGERGLPGVVIFSDMNGNGELDPNEPSTLTRGDTGVYRLNLEPGPHVIREVVPRGFRQTFPMGPAEVFEKSSHNLPPGQALSFEMSDAAIDETQLDLTFRVVWPNGCGTLLGGRSEVHTEGDQILVQMSGTQAGDVCTQALKPEQQTLRIDTPPPGVYHVRAVLHESAGRGEDFERSFTFNSALALDANGGYHVVVLPSETVEALRFGNVPTERFHVADFDMDGRVGVPDIDLLTDVIQGGQHGPDFDLSGDGKVDEADLDEMVRGVMGTVYGDVNLDGSFDSSDLVKIFQGGKFEDGIDDNASWAEGDFDGDGDFTTSDLVVVFQEGKFEGAAAVDAAFRR